MSNVATDNVKAAGKKVDNSVKFLSNTGHSDPTLLYLYIKYLKFYWNRNTAKHFSFVVTVQHILYWRAQMIYFGSDLIRRNMYTRIDLQNDLRFSYDKPLVEDRLSSSEHSVNG